MTACTSRCTDTVRPAGLISEYRRSAAIASLAASSPSVWAQHAYGLAVDINPFENPEIQDGNADASGAVVWADRSRSSPALIRDGDAAWRAFRASGWTWGGDWRSLKDYMHFSANGL